MTLTERSARKELRALVARAVQKEAGVPEAAARRIANRILRDAGRLAEIGAALGAREPAAGPASAAPAAPDVPAPAGAFDPYALGAVVTLHRHGADVLMERLGEIARVEDLARLAAAQNLAVRPGWSTAEELRAAIVRSAEQRLAERRAAAS